MLEDQQDSIAAVSARLKHVRESLGFDKRGFAEGANMSEQAYGAFENGKRELSLQAAKKLRKRYRLSLEFLYYGITDDLPTRISKYL
ncbi:helix-turn-helix domain-containing protein [Phaeobacter sp. C3_T13_0]|uniref:helix-turn-helix domain-containing protein n=1 Tax=Phaeobacter cretensis TaxID=3342641 RepID=UPI0039BD1EF6